MSIGARVGRAGAVVALTGLAVTSGAGSAAEVTLTGIARLAAETFAAGPPSGAFLEAGVRGAPRFPGQAVQGVSSIAPAGEGWWWVLVDNGFGTRLNSPDALLRIHKLRPRWREASGGEASLEVAGEFVQLADPDRRLPFHLVNETTAARALTGADLDPESMVVDADGTFWIGDEFGPFLIHVARTGRVLEPPAEAPGLRSPDHPLLAPADRGRTSEATVGRSRGFEGLGHPPGSRSLFALLEAGGASDSEGTTRILEFDLAERRWTGRTWSYRFEPEGVAVSELVCYEDDRCLVIERDNGHGPAARFKRVFAVRLAAPGGEVAKTPVADLLGIGDPDRLAGPAGAFTFPFVTTEALWPVDARTLVLVNDNNFPATGGRAAGVRDQTEMIRLRLASPLP